MNKKIHTNEYSRIVLSGDQDFCRQIREYINHNNLEAGAGSAYPELKICAVASKEALAECLNNISDSALYILSSGIAADVYETNRGLYQLFEKQQAEIFAENAVDRKLIKLIQTDTLFRLLAENADKEIPVDKQGVYCFWPWFNMYLRGDIVEWCCGYYHTEPKLTQENESASDIIEWWNHSSFQKVRDVIKCGDKKGNCSRCHNLYFNQFFPYVFDFQKLTGGQEANLAHAIYHYWLKSKELSSSPVRYELITTFRCNIDCIMCNQEIYKHSKYSLKSDFFIKNRDKLSKALQISLLGGEFFFLEESRKIIAELGNEAYSSTQIMFITNGLQLDKFTDELLLIKKALFSISLDGVGDTYESIRKGSKWDKVEKNLFRLRSLIKEHNLDWEIQIPSVIMLNSIKGLGEFTDWCVEHGFSPSFIQMEHVEGVTEEQDVFRYTDLLSSIENWRDIFESSLAKLEKNKLHNSYSTLKSIYKVLLAKDIR